VIPKKWRFPEMLPMDAQGKKKKEDILLLFSGEETETESGSFKSAACKSAASTSEGFYKIDNEKIIEKTENSLALEFSIPGDSPYFDGHFPKFPILPAVAQAELILRFAARHLGTSISPLEIKRVKFTNFIRPETPLLLKLSKKEKTISFNINSPDGETAYSLGTIIMGQK
jgi:3-hydroxyacyl-[acyl-carrier-protein] dehydratase